MRDTGLSLITKAEKTFDGRILATGFGRVTRRAAIDAVVRAVGECHLPGVEMVTLEAAA